MSTLAWKRLASLGFAFALLCSPVASVAGEAVQQLSAARGLVKSGEYYVSESLLRQAINEFWREKDFRGLGEAELEYAALTQAHYVANAASASELAVIEAVHAGYMERAALALEYALASIEYDDYKNASEVYLRIADIRSRLNQSMSACKALAQALDYRIEAVAARGRTGAYQPVSMDLGGAREVLARARCSGALAHRVSAELASR